MEIIFVLLILLHVLDASPYDNGKYVPKKYRNDGKYYRPPHEGEYVHTNDGNYFYIYQKGIYPTNDGDYRYIHQEGPRGPDGNNFGREGRDGWGGGEGSGGFEGSGGGEGGIGPDGFLGYFGPNGIDGPTGPDGPDGPNGWNRDIPIYADKYPYIKQIVIHLADQYVSNNTINYGDESEESKKIFKELRMDNATAIKCHSLYPDSNATVTVNEFPDLQQIDDNDYIGTYYRFSGTKCIDVASSLTKAKKKLKLHYEVLVKVIDEFTEYENNEK